jgi:hypothetical protein
VDDVQQDISVLRSKEQLLTDNQVAQPPPVDEVIPKWKREPGKRGRLSTKERGEQEANTAARAAYNELRTTLLSSQEAYAEQLERATRLDDQTKAKEREIANLNEDLKARNDTITRLSNRYHGHLGSRNLVNLIIAQITRLTRREVKRIRASLSNDLKSIVSFSDGVREYTVHGGTHCLEVRGEGLKGRSFPINNLGLTADTFLALPQQVGVQLSMEELRERTPAHLIREIYDEPNSGITPKTIGEIGKQALGLHFKLSKPPSADRVMGKETEYELRPTSIGRIMSDLLSDPLHGGLLRSDPGFGDIPPGWTPNGLIP